MLHRDYLEVCGPTCVRVVWMTDSDMLSREQQRDLNHLCTQDPEENIEQKQGLVPKGILILESEPVRFHQE